MVAEATGEAEARAPEPAGDIDIADAQPAAEATVNPTIAASATGLRRTIHPKATGTARTSQHPAKAAASPCPAIASLMVISPKRMYEIRRRAILHQRPPWNSGTYRHSGARPDRLNGGQVRLI